MLKCEISLSATEMFGKYLDKLNTMPKEELRAYLDKIEGRNEPLCDPKTCQGSCQGMGWCQDYIDFRKGLKF